MKIELGEPIVVTQARQADLPWGVFQFPTLNRLGSDRLVLSYSQAPDLYLDSAKDYAPMAALISDDGGKSWRPCDMGRPVGRHENWLRRNCESLVLLIPPWRDVPKRDLPPPVAYIDDNYGGRIAMRDPKTLPPNFAQWQLARHSGTGDEWEVLDVAVDDPDEAIRSYDPLGKDYTTFRWTPVAHLVDGGDGSLLALVSGWRLNADRTPQPKMQTWLWRSTDDGRTWRFHAVVARDDRHPQMGYCEPTMARMPDGRLLAMLRTECQLPGPLCATRSADGGRTWTEPQQVHPFGVRPITMALECGVAAVSFGRPGTHMLFCADGRGEKWENLTTLTPAEEGWDRDPKDHTLRAQNASGYSDMVPTGPDSFLVVYDDFNYPSPAGPRKTILIRSVRVI
jgi:hypothetical protein